MIRLLMSITTVLLFFVSYYLLAKQPIFFTLITEDMKNLQFLKNFGRIYALLGVLGIVVAVLNERFLAFIFLFLVILIASVFSISFARKMAAPKQ